MNEKWIAVYYGSRDGKHSLIHELQSFGTRDYLKIVKAVDLLVEFGFNQASDRVKHIDGKLWELRVDRFRVLYFLHLNGHFVLLRAFMKKTTRTPREEIEIAKARMNEYIEQT